LLHFITSTIDFSRQAKHFFVTTKCFLTSEITCRVLQSRFLIYHFF